MNTQTHVLLAAAILTRQGEPARNVAVIAGALVPDLAIYTLFVWSKIAAVPEQRVWSELYFQPPWSEAVTVGNSAPLYVLILLVALLASRWLRPATALIFFALAALLHLVTDFPVHVDDAHAHLWPFSDWRFRSPVSYWNPDHNGGVFSVLEVGLGIALSLILWRRFQAKWVRALLFLAIVAYLGPPIYFEMHTNH
ncbi:hypothetical protein [Hoeflea prorocentri]|uniref:Cobalamin biosynthesis protein CobQ n=1 Tax=Hoeflea prorocentri TaxID=1922333 RepID=A0A9X3ZGA8_9HYPH|nr:hypothetical protein [Hoeflea prorocentri]MCY6379545.1 hypothetical protein [Hoeflea prorocentri]MDA5397345.1 hypothetical protein [Hoeflea prorocentri]